jgi:hypothetical protein
VRHRPIRKYGFLFSVPFIGPPKRWSHNHRESGSLSNRDRQKVGMWEWSDKLKLGKGSAFVKQDLRPLPLTDAEFEVDFFLDPVYSTKRQQAWKGMVVEREFG